MSPAINELGAEDIWEAGRPDSRAPCHVSRGNCLGRGPVKAEARDSVISGTATIVICRTGRKTALGHLAISLAEKPPATDFAVGICRFGLLIMRLTVLMVLFVLVVNVSLHRPVLELLDVRAGAGRRVDPRAPADDRDRHARAFRIAAVEAEGDRKASVAIHDLGAMNVLCTDKTGTLTEATIKLMRAIDGRGTDSKAVFANAYINSQFETGMKSPLDQAICSPGHSIWPGGERSTRCHSISSDGASRSWSNTAPCAA